MMAPMHEIIPSAIATTLSVINSAVSSLKNAKDMAKDSTDTSLKAIISESYDAVLDLKERVLDLDEENRTLRQKLERRDSVKRDRQFGYYFKDGDTQDPLCPKCYEGDDKLVYLPHPENVGGGIRRICLHCQMTFWERRIQDYSPPADGGDYWMR
jgi:hypothetical protein